MPCNDHTLHASAYGSFRLSPRASAQSRFCGETKSRNINTLLCFLVILVIFCIPRFMLNGVSITLITRLVIVKDIFTVVES